MQGMITCQQISNCSTGHGINDNSFKTVSFQDWKYIHLLQQRKDVKSYNNTNKYNTKGFGRRAGD